MTKIMYSQKDRDFDGYSKLLEMMESEFDKICSIADWHLYKTDVTDLYQIFLDNIPEVVVQHYRCDACRRFVNKYGSLVTITENGELIPAIWPKYGPGIFYNAVAAVREHLTTKAKVISVFYTDRTDLGTPQTGEWRHMSVHLNDRLLMKAHPGVYGNCGERMSASQNDYAAVWRAINDYSIDVVREAMKLINSGALFRSDKVRNTCSAFLNLLNDINGEIPAVKTAKVWRYIASATDPGYLHIRSSVIGTLLDDIKDGVDMDTIIKKFNDKMDPLKYQRPQAAPSTGNIKRAEQLFKELGFTSKSLERRYATLEDLETIWTPRDTEGIVEESDGVFGRLKSSAKDAPKVTKVDGVIDRGAMTWNKFYNEILPHAKSIKINNTSNLPYFSISTFLTAVYPDEKCIFRYGNHVSNYMHSASLVRDNVFSAFNIHNMAEVVGICYDPVVWGRTDNFPDTVGVNFIIKDAKDLIMIRNGSQNTGIFPESLIPELREVRSTIAAYSESDIIKGEESASATGLRIQRDIDYKRNINFIVDTDTMGTLSLYIDRWE